MLSRDCVFAAVEDVDDAAAAAEDDKAEPGGGKGSFKPILVVASSMSSPKIRNLCLYIYYLEIRIY